MCISKLKILAIDDEPVILKSLEKIFSLWDVKVTTTLNSADFYSLIKENKYDIIISDIMMPDPDGFELLKFLKENNLQTTFIITSGYSTTANTVKAISEGAFDFIPKPFSADEIYSISLRAKIFNKYKYDKAYSDRAPDGYLKFGDLSWAKECYDGIWELGLTDITVNSIEQISKIDRPNSLSTIIQSDRIFKIYNKENNLFEIPSPLSGAIVEINERLFESPEMLLNSPYEDGWIYKIIPDNLTHEKQFLINERNDD